MSSQLAFGASKSPSPPSPSPCQSPSPCESASASVPHLHLHHHLHLHVHHHLRLRLHLHRHPHRLISVLLLRLIHNTKRYDRCRVGGCPEGLAISYVFVSAVGGRWGRRGVGFLAASRALKLGSRAVRSLEKRKGRRRRRVTCPTVGAPADKKNKSSGGAVLRIFSRTCICMVSTGAERLNPSFSV